MENETVRLLLIIVILVGLAIFGLGFLLSVVDTYIVILLLTFSVPIIIGYAVWKKRKSK